MKWKLKFKEKLYHDLHTWLFSTSPNENGCFLLGQTKGNILFIEETYYPEDPNWIINNRDLCVPSAAYISSACIKANLKGLALVFIHTHPEDNHPSTFSILDKESNCKLFNNLSEITNYPLGSLVLSQKGIHGTMFNEKKYQSIESYTIIGKNLRVVYDTLSLPKIKDLDEFERQIRFMKKEGLSIFSNLKIAIVGLGGIGSPVAVMLAKMGVKSIDLFDHDKAEIHNLPRIYGATKNDLGKYKVDIVREHISLFSDCEISTFRYKVENNISDFLKYDVIFGCLDNHTARAFLNTVSIELAIPYIDSACAIPLDNENKPIQAVTAVTTVMPLKTCLWCSGVLNGVKIMEEELNIDELNKREHEGYTKNVENAPSVITLTTAVATIAVNRLLNLLGILDEDYPIRVIHDFNNTMLIEPEILNNENCICKKNSPLNDK